MRYKPAIVVHDTILYIISKCYIPDNGQSRLSTTVLTRNGDSERLLAGYTGA